MPLDDNNKTEVSASNDTPYELESQFILRLPSLAAASLKAAVKSGVTNLRDRLTIQLEADMRRGIVRFDGWVLPAKVVDLPTIIESHKTLDGKNFYKTADICQMMICKEEADDSMNKGDENEDMSTAKKLKDGKDKKYLYPHGITPPLKNVRKKRFRKTLKKKYVDFPEIEKEVKRLFRTDNDAISVRYEVVNADDEMKSDNTKSNALSPAAGGNSTGFDVGEHELFGDAVSSSDDEDTRAPPYSDDESRMSSSRLDVLLKEDLNKNSPDSYVMTEFRGILSTENDTMRASNYNNAQSSYDMAIESSNAVDAMGAAMSLAEDTAASSMLVRGAESEALYNKLREIEDEIANLQAQRLAQQNEMDNIENIALKQRFQTLIDDLKSQENAKQREYDEISAMINE